MRLRWRIALLYFLALSAFEIVEGWMVSFELRHFLLQDSLEDLRDRSVPTITTHMEQAAAGRLSLAGIVSSLTTDLAAAGVGAAVFDRTGRSIAAVTPPLGTSDPAPLDPGRMREALRGQSTWMVRSAGGSREMVLYLPLRPSGEPGAMGVVQLTSPLHRADHFFLGIRSWLLATAAAVILAGCGVAVFLSGRLAAPVERLTTTCRAIAGGAWGRRSELSHGTDEVGQLATAFDDMVHRLQSAIEAQQRFVADAAHRLKTPLTALSGHLELLERGVIGEEDRIHASYRVMRGQVQRLGNMVKKMLTLSTLDSGPPLRRRRVDLAALGRAVARDFLPLAGGRTLDVLPIGDTRAEVDPHLLHEALTNLVDNAIRHTDPNGSIFIEVGNNWITVRDTGTGIPPERLDRIFDRFYTYPPNAEGSGLGLAIVRTIVEAHGGSVSTHSEPGQGTRITLRLTAGV